MTTTKRSFVAPAPFEDETLSSWFRRLATSYGLKPQELHYTLLPGGYLYSYDLDRYACPSLIDEMERTTEVSKLRIQRMTLFQWDQVLRNADSNVEKLRWRPTAWRQGISRSYGQQICPTCLTMDDEPYYRSNWRLSCLTVCRTHGTLMLDRCPDCGEGLQVLKADLSKNAHTSCWKCSSDFRRANTFGTPETGASAILENVLKSGWGLVGEYGYVHSIAYFERPCRRQKHDGTPSFYMCCHNLAQGC